MRSTPVRRRETAIRVNLASSPASVEAAALLSALISLGLTDVVVCPGARSQALALAAWQLEQQGRLHVHVRIDERSAAFFALGIARETGRAAAVVTTSGTAVANLMPAVLEAHHGAVPLLLITADRPEELQGIGSNQTTVQPGIFGVFTRANLNVPAPAEVTSAIAAGSETAGSAWSAAHEATPGPVHVNLAFRVPLSGGDIDWDALHAAAVRDRAEHPLADGPQAASQSATESATVQAALNEFVPAVVVAGRDAGPAAEAFAREARLPLIAEVVSGARFGREAITQYRALLNDDALATQIRRVVVFGTPTLSREVPRLAQREDVELVVVSPPGREFFNPGRRLSEPVGALTLGPNYDRDAAHRWLGEWVLRDRDLIAAHTTVHQPDLEAARATEYKARSAYAKAEVAAMREPVTRAMLAEALWRATWPHDRLVLGASKLIRVLDTVAQPRNVPVISNRGLAGIDGTISTAAGVAVASQEGGMPGVTRALLGDITALHDVGGLFWGAGEPQPRIQLFVGNDGGGAIFDALEVASTADPEAFDRVLFTPQAVSFEHLAAAYGWRYVRVMNRGELDAVLTAPVTGPEIVEVTLQRRESTAG